ncbi:MAG: sensor domain-containing diguanylate cyclase [Gammaproteobacteria bacterium]|nr:sensor domain-containing diguanylate cyclase [Gammaproteobacteria bacterium]
MKMQHINEALIASSNTLSQRFLMLVQAMSGVRSLTSLETEGLQETDLLGRVLDILIQDVDLDRCSIFLLEGNRLYCAVAKSWEDHQQQTRKPPDKQSYIFEIGEGAMGIAAKNRRIYHCHNCKEDKNFLPNLHLHSEKNTGSLICTPIMLGDELLGVLNISHPDTNFFHAWQEHVLNIHANILAQMLHSHRLVNDMREQVNKRTRQLENALRESEELKSTFEELSLIDELTRLYNRRYFFMEVPRVLSHCIRHEESFSLLLLDLDNFKLINDTHGHSAGDQVLKDVGILLKNQTRTGDVVVRMGGEEFIFILSNTHMKGAKVFAERIRTLVAELTWYGDHTSFDVTMSIGITERNNRTGDEDLIIRELLREADHALYECKDLGKNQTKLFADLASESVRE